MPIYITIRTNRNDQMKAKIILIEMVKIMVSYCNCLYPMMLVYAKCVVFFSYVSFAILPEK